MSVIKQIYLPQLVAHKPWKKISSSPKKLKPPADRCKIADNTIDQITAVWQCLPIIGLRLAFSLSSLQALFHMTALIGDSPIAGQ